MVNENEALEAVADKVDDDTDPIPKDESAIVINWRHGTLPMLTIVLEDGTQRVTRRALRPGERRHNNYYQRKKKSSIHTLWAKSAQLLFKLKFISRIKPLYKLGGMW